MSRCSDCYLLQVIYRLTQHYQNHMTCMQRLWQEGKTLYQTELTDITLQTRTSCTCQLFRPFSIGGVESHTIAGAGNVYAWHMMWLDRELDVRWSSKRRIIFSISLLPVKLSIFCKSWYLPVRLSVFCKSWYLPVCLSVLCKSWYLPVCQSVLCKYWYLPVCVSVLCKSWYLPVCLSVLYKCW